MKTIKLKSGESIGPELLFKDYKVKGSISGRSFETIKEVFWCGKLIGWVDRAAPTTYPYFQPGKDSPSGTEPYQFQSETFEKLAAWMQRYYLNNYRKMAADYRESLKASV